MRLGALAHSEATRRLHTAACKLTDLPKCAACQFGKQKCRPTPGKRSSVVRDREGSLKQNHLAPGQQVSLDHFDCSTKGRLFGTRGKTNQDTMYCGGCIFVDHVSNYVHVEFQVHLTTHEMLKAKEKYELMSRDFGIVVQSFLSDNGSVFSSKKFAAHLSKFEQIIHFAGAGAHHQNGCAERAIQSIMSISRTMMLHSAIHWPEKLPTLVCGPWPSSTSSFCTVTCQMNRLVSLHMPYSPGVDGNSASFTTCTFGGAPLIVYKRTCMMAKSSLGGNSVPVAP
jgi:hypothetical protein